MAGTNRLVYILVGLLVALLLLVLVLWMLRRIKQKQKSAIQAGPTSEV